MFWSSARETQETWLALATDHGKYIPLYVWQLWINVMTFLQCSLIIVLDVICSCSWHALLMPGITKTHNKPYLSNCREKTPQQNFEGEPQTMTKCAHIGNLTTVTPNKSVLEHSCSSWIAVSSSSSVSPHWLHQPHDCWCRFQVYNNLPKTSRVKHHTKQLHSEFLLHSRSTKKKTPSHWYKP
jgi:hypothetical protein